MSKSELSRRRTLAIWGGLLGGLGLGGLAGSIIVSLGAGGTIEPILISGLGFGLGVGLLLASLYRD